MQTQAFTDHPRVRERLAELRAAREATPENFVFSDVVDAAGRQYVDLVQEGGGTLGVALVGYTYVLEQMGIRFVSLAGTSAGAINTVLLAALDRPEAAKSPELIELLAGKDFYDFIDGDRGAHRFIQALTDRAGLLTLLYRGAWIIDDLRTRMGLNPGRRFYRWMREVLNNNDIDSTRALLANMNAFSPGLQLRETVEDKNRRIQARLGVVAADLTTETKVVFPGMAGLYFEEPEEVHPAEYVRASMSIPLFFEPYLAYPPRGRAEQWAEQALYTGETPQRAVLVDGGILSNFPIDIFHISDKVPSRPTFGVKLGLERNCPKGVEDYKQLAYGCFNAASQMRDHEFIRTHPDYRHLVATIDVGEHDWMNFRVSDEAKVDLFVRGAETAAGFLLSFRWEEYKELRAQLLRGKQEHVWERAVSV